MVETSHEPWRTHLFWICGIMLCWEKAVRNTWPGETMELWIYEAMELVYGHDWRAFIRDLLFWSHSFWKVLLTFYKGGDKECDSRCKRKIFCGMWTWVINKFKKWLNNLCGTVESCPTPLLDPGFSRNVFWGVWWHAWHAEISRSDAPWPHMYHISKGEAWHQQVWHGWGMISARENTCP